MVRPMSITCQGCGEADAEFKCKETIGGGGPDHGKVLWFRYLCPVCLERDYGPWLRLMK